MSDVCQSVVLRVVLDFFLIILVDSIRARRRAERRGPAAAVIVSDGEIRDEAGKWQLFIITGQVGFSQAEIRASLVAAADLAQ